MRNLVHIFKHCIKNLRPINIQVNNVTLAENDLLRGKNVIVTGAGSGIGKAIAKQYINCGAIVIGIGRSQDKLNEVSYELGANKFFPYCYDVSDIKNLPRAVDDICSLFPESRIDILVNCAGVKNGNDEKFFDYTEKDFDFVINTNLKGVFFMCQEVAKRMLSSNNRGHIVNVISIKGFIGEASPYSLSKWGCVSITKGLARILAPYGIVVNGIAPGGTRTPMALDHSKTWVHKATPSMRLADPDEIANIAVFLGSDLGNNIIGDVIISDGGQILQYSNNRL